jgi:uncharacterized membrane protein
MQDDNERVRQFFAGADTRPPGLSTVDVARAIDTGKRRRRVRRLGLGVGVASLSLGVTAVIAIPHAIPVDPGPDRAISAAASPSVEPSPAPSAKPAFRTRSYQRPAARALPTSCQGTKLAVPGGGIKSYVSNLDPSGKFATGRIYNDDMDPVLWRDGQATRVPMGGDDDILEAANAKGDAVGFSYPESGPRAMAYIGGTLRELKGGSAQPTGINQQGRISGTLEEGRQFTPVVWPSADAEPVPLPLPDGVRVGRANDIDEDGTVVGNIGDSPARTAYVWYPDGTGQALPAPVLDGQPAVDFDARRVRNGWVTGFVSLGKAGSGVRWDLTTGKVEVVDKIRSSMDVSPHGWIVGSDHNQDAVLTDGTTVFPLPNVFPKPAEYGMNWGQAISDDGLTIAGTNDDKAHDGEQRAVVWKCR